MKITLQFALCCFALAGTALAEQPSDNLKDVVARNYPAELTAYARRHHLTERRKQAFVSIEIVHAHFIVAAYSGGQIGAVVLMERKSENVYTVEQSIVGEHMQGRSPSVEAVDVDGDGVPEIVVYFALPRGGQTSIFRISNHRLNAIGPSTDRGTPVLGYPAVVDLDGKGLRDLIDVSSFRKGGEEEPTIRYAHYVLKNGKYVAGAPVDYYHVFYRDDHPQTTETTEFSIPKESVGKRFKLTIINGDESGAEFRVPRAVVALNGVRVSSGGDVSRDRGTWTIPVTLQENNSIRVDLCVNASEDGKHSDEDGGADQECGELGRIGIVIHHD